MQAITRWPAGGITFGPEDAEGEPEPRDISEPATGFEAQAPDGTAFAVTRGEDGSLVFTDPASGEQRSLPANFVGEVEAATAGDPAQRHLILRIAVETSLIESGGFAGEGTSEAERRQTFERLDAAILEQLGPEDGANARAIADLRRALQRSLRATNQRDKLFHIQRDALPEAHRAAVLESAKRFGIEAADVLTDLLPVVGEIKAGLRAQEALEAYEAALEAGDTEAANQHLLAFGEALTEAVPVAGKGGRLTRAVPGLDRIKAKIGRLAADLLGAGKLPRGRADGTQVEITSGDGRGLERPGRDEGVARPDDTPSSQSSVGPRNRSRQELERDITDERQSGRLTDIDDHGAKAANRKFLEDLKKRNPNGPPGKPPYDENFPAYSGRIAKREESFVRVFQDGGDSVGNWLIREAEFDMIRDLPNAPDILKDLFALPSKPELFVRVTLPKGTKVITGVAGPIEGWGPGGGLQFNVQQRANADWFTEPERITR